MLLKVSAEDAANRIDRFASEKSEITRSQIHKFIDEGLLLVNGSPVKPNYKVREGDQVEITLPERPPDELIPEDIPVDILYSDEHIAVVNKPAGLVVYPAAGHPSGTLMNALRFSLGELTAPGAPLRPGVVHRLDKDTSGIMVVALSDQAYHGLVEQFSERTIKRSYVALLWGRLKGESGKISIKIGRSMTDRKKMSVRTRKGKEAETSWDVLERFRGATLVRAKLSTGRTHQIRVHFASAGHPVLGDETYGKKTSIALTGKEKLSFPRQMLHAKVLGFRHPVTDKKMRFTSPLSQDMQEALEALREQEVDESAAIT
jgi:23S rRNA pseudouridine1911/1915/1917 synthase